MSWQPRIAVVDDVDANRRLLEQILRRGGFEDVRPYPSGSDFLTAFEDRKADLILLDLHMPTPDGFAVLAAIRDRQPEGEYLPVLVLTADADRSARSRALAGGANDFLTKPFDAEEVLLRVRNLIETRRLQDMVRSRNAELLGEVAAQAERLAANEAHWAEVGAALNRLGPLGSPEATAAAICRELLRLPDLEMVGIIGFMGGGTMVPLAIEGARSARSVIDRSMPERWSSRFSVLLRSGTWLGSLATLADQLSLPEMHEQEATEVALVPLGHGGDPVGFLGAAARGADGLAGLGRRLPALEAFAAVAGALLIPAIVARRDTEDSRATLQTIIAERAFTSVFQPIVGLKSGTIAGFEALTRFADGTRPDHRFAEAEAVGLGLELEAVSLESALAAATPLPPDAWVSLNVSPAFALEGTRLQTLVRATTRPLVIELTEHVPVEDYAALRDAIAALGPSVRYAIDDAGAGFASFRHILELRPDFVKLDIGLVRNIERDPARQALLAGMRYFAVKTGCTLIAEGIETEAERRQLDQLAIDLGQGYLLGRPAEAGSSWSESGQGPRSDDPAPASMGRSTRAGDTP